MNVITGIVNPKFTGVTIDKTNRDVSFTGGTFKGNYAPLEITDANRSSIVTSLPGSPENINWESEGLDDDDVLR
jgi:hypothetical protein